MSSIFSCPAGPLKIGPARADYWEDARGACLARRAGGAKTAGQVPAPGCAMGNAKFHIANRKSEMEDLKFEI